MGDSLAKPCIAQFSLRSCVPLTGFRSNSKILGYLEGFLKAKQLLLTTSGHYTKRLSNSASKDGDDWAKGLCVGGNRNTSNQPTYMLSIPEKSFRQQLLQCCAIEYGGWEYLDEDLDGPLVWTPATAE